MNAKLTIPMKTNKANNIVGTEVVVVHKTVATQKWNSGDYWEDDKDRDDTVAGVYLADTFDNKAFECVLEGIAVDECIAFRDSVNYYDGPVTVEKCAFSPYSKKEGGFADMSVEGGDLKWRRFVEVKTSRAVIGEIHCDIENEQD